jgi:hypothetical protein
METLSKVDDIQYISSKMKVPRNKVKLIIDTYIKYVKEKISSGETIGFLRICDFVVKDYDGPRETLGYVCHEVGNKIDVPGDLVKNVLLYYETSIINDLKKYRGHTITGVMRLRMIKSYNGKIVLDAARSSSIVRGSSVYLSARKSFKRKVEVTDDR